MAYAHEAPGDEGSAVSVLLINLHPEETATVAVSGLEPGEAEGYLVTADGLDAAEVRLGAETLRLKEDGSLPEIGPLGFELSGGATVIQLAPSSYFFLRSPGRG